MPVSDQVVGDPRHFTRRVRQAPELRVIIQQQSIGVEPGHSTFTRKGQWAGCPTAPSRRRHARASYRARDRPRPCRPRRAVTGSRKGQGANPAGSAFAADYMTGAPLEPLRDSVAASDPWRVSPLIGYRLAAGNILCQFNTTVSIEDGACGLTVLIRNRWPSADTPQ
jgi:hypothetical protein